MLLCSAKINEQSQYGLADRMHIFHELEKLSISQESNTVFISLLIFPMFVDVSLKHYCHLLSKWFIGHRQLLRHL
ncbi:hypothetical protein WUBG_17152, partial [Wuchereria bancrofti]